MKLDARNSSSIETYKQRNPTRTEIRVIEQEWPTTEIKSVATVI